MRPTPAGAPCAASTRSPTECARHRSEFGGEYRFETEGDHPLDPLRERGAHEDLAYWRTTRALTPQAQLP